VFNRHSAAIRGQLGRDQGRVRAAAKKWNRTSEALSPLLFFERLRRDQGHQQEAVLEE
jgi:hypothetical protein